VAAILSSRYAGSMKGKMNRPLTKAEWGQRKCVAKAQRKRWIKWRAQKRAATLTERELQIQYLQKRLTEINGKKAGKRVIARVIGLHPSVVQRTLDRIKKRSSIRI